MLRVALWSCRPSCGPCCRLRKRDELQTNLPLMLQIYLWAQVYAENWSAFAPDFEELEENIELVEQEDEFDVNEREADKAKAAAKAASAAGELCRGLCMGHVHQEADRAKASSAAGDMRVDSCMGSLDVSAHLGSLRPPVGAGGRVSCQQAQGWHGKDGSRCFSAAGDKSALCELNGMHTWTREIYMLLQEVSCSRCVQQIGIACTPASADVEPVSRCSRSGGRALRRQPALPLNG